MALFVFLRFCFYALLLLIFVILKMLNRPIERNSILSFVIPRFSLFLSQQWWSRMEPMYYWNVAFIVCFLSILIQHKYSLKVWIECWEYFSMCCGMIKQWLRFVWFDVSTSLDWVEYSKEILNSYLLYCFDLPSLGNCDGLNAMIACKQHVINICSLKSRGKPQST